MMIVSMIISFLREYYSECIIGLIVSVFVILLGEFITNGKLTKPFLIRFFAIMTPIVLFAVLLNDPNFFPTPTPPADDPAITATPVPAQITATVQQVTFTPKPTATFTPEPTKSLTRALPSSPYRDEIPDSWEEIIAAIDDGTAQRRYAVGAYKPLNLGQFGTVNMQLAGFNLDDRADGQGKAATTWIAKEILSETHRWNPWWDDGKEGTGTIGGWAKCELRRWMNERVLSAIPKDVRDRLISVKKSQESYDTNWNWIRQTTENSVWIPSRDEVFGDQSLYYGLFRNQDDRRVKTRDGSAAWWWLRSAASIISAYYVGADGSNSDYSVDYTSGGVVLGFCL